MNNQTKTKKSEKIRKNKKKTILLINLAVWGLIATFVAVYAWFFYTRQLETLTWIKTPIQLDIRSGNNHDIAYLDMGSIDADTPDHTVEYVFSVYGEPVDIYSLQLAYTTNIPFYYEIYRANLSSESAEHAENTESSRTVTFTYTEDNQEKTETFIYNPKDNPVISAKPLNQLTENEIQVHQSHDLSYGDDKGENAVNKSAVQSNAEPLYWLAREKGLNVLQPEHTGTTSSGNKYFCDYFVIKIYWDPDTVINNKETDMVYLTASR